MAFKFSLQNQLDKIKNELQGRGNDRVVFLLIVIVAMVLDPVPDTLDVFNGLFFFVRNSQTEIL